MELDELKHVKNLKIEEVLEKINKELENKLSISDVKEILDITKSFSDELRSKVVENRDVSEKNVYCIILNTSITDRQLLEYMESLIITDEGIFLFYNENMRLD